jgi:hypothetical protein
MSISNIGIDPGVTDTGLVGQASDSITLSNTVPATLSRVGIVSVPASLTAGAAPVATIIGAQPAYITVVDVTHPANLVYGTDYTLAATGGGSQLTYSVLRVATSPNSTNNDICTVTYLYGDMPDTAYAIGETYAQSQVAITTGGNQYSAGTYPGSTYGAADTTGTSVAGIGPALPGGSVSDVIPWAGSGQAGGQTGTVSQHDYSALQGIAGQQPQAVYGWSLGSPDTEAVYGGPTTWWGSAFSPQLGSYSQGDVGAASDPGIWDTTIGGGSLYQYAIPATAPVYRNPYLGVAAFNKDTSLTDILGNQISAAALTNAAYYALNVDSNPWGAYPAGGPPGGWAVAPSAPVGLSLQTDPFSATAAGTAYYLSQGGVVPSSVVVTNTTQSLTMVLNTDYSLTTAGNGPDTYCYVTPIVAAHYANGNNISVAYSYGSPQYWDSNAPASVPGAPGLGSTTSQTDNVASFTAGASALSKVGIVTPPASMSVIDQTGPRAGNVLVMNLDYTVTVSGSGSTLTYSIARLAGSTGSNSGDSVNVTYFYGNAAYFTSGPCLPVNRGAQIAWTPPAGTTEVDFYLVQSMPDLGTQFVPKSGLQDFNGLPNVAGSDDYGQPANQTDSINLVLAALTAPTISSITHGGTTGATTYGYRIAALNLNGTTLAGAELTTATGNAALTGVNTNIIAWGAIAGATAGYAIYGRTSGAELFMGTVAAGVTTFTDTGAVTPSGALPAANTTVATLSKTAIVTPAGQLIVRDLTSTALTVQGASSTAYNNLVPTGGTLAQPAATDMLQPMGQVLMYGVDYTVTQVANGPWLTYQLNLAQGSVNAFITDTIQVDYWYNQEGDVPLTAANDTIVLVAGSAALLHSSVVTAAQSLVVYDTTISKPLAYGIDFTVTSNGVGPTRVLTVSLLAGGSAGAGNTDTLHVYYLYGSALTSYFTQGLLQNTPLIWRPNGTVYSWQGYQFQIAAGNRLGLGPFSSLSDYVVPLNYQAPQPGFEGTTQTITFRDPANSINPIYRPDGTTLSGTGLG